MASHLQAAEVKPVPVLTPIIPLAPKRKRERVLEKIKKALAWLDADHNAEQGLARREASIERQRLAPSKKKTDIARLAPFAFLHLGCLAVFWVGVSPVAVGVALALYWARVFFVSAFFHRYFSHRTYSTNRFWQFIFALCCSTTIQRGALWWAANHRHHHKYSDEPPDLHSPKQSGIWWAHLGWMTDEANMYTDYKLIPDLAKYPELVFLNRFDWLGGLFYGLALLGAGSLLHHFAPQLNTNGPQLLVWGLFVSTVVLFHGTCTINSLAHVFGSRRYETTDTSRNNFFLALLTFGEGWHNNHHKYQGAVRQGFYWWEIDISFYILNAMSWLGIVYDLHPVPVQAYDVSNHRKQS
ncbi:MAG: acyl-CoA desaturase [Vampirovibrionales bacterium]|nr:acyl-CoA desaturase [Vampirovibrionales bacterium]